MQENNVIYEITKQIQDKNNIQQDVQQAFNLVTDMFRKKYIDKIDEELKVRINKIEQNPPKEIVLLNAIKQFLDKSKHKDIDNTITMLRNFSAINSLKESLNQTKNINVASNNVVYANNFELDSSIKEDGVYDIDENCIFGISNKNTFAINQNFLMLFILLIIMS